MAGLAAVATLSACGFDYPTDRINNITAGANYRDGTVNILNAAVVSKQANSGTFIATFVNNNQTDAVTLQSMSGDNTAIGQVTVPPIRIPPNGLVNLANKGGIPVNGTFVGGNFVTLSFQFSDGSSATMEVPVVADTPHSQWAGLDISTPSPATGSPSPTS